MANTSESKNTTARKERRKAWWKKQQEKGSSEPQGEGVRLRVRKPKVENDQPRQASVVETQDGFKLKLKLNNSLPVKVGKKTVTKPKKKPLQSQGTSTIANSGAVSNPKKKSRKPKIPTPAETSAPKSSPKTYVLFVGNLPFDITKEQLLDHFRKTGGAKSVRIPKERGTDKGRGFAYIEFRDGISFRVGLRLHQTTLAGRKINVEFTSIGGNNKNRREKLNAKNKALEKLKVPIGNSKS